MKNMCLHFEKTSNSFTTICFSIIGTVLLECLYDWGAETVNSKISTLSKVVLDVFRKKKKNENGIGAAASPSCHSDGPKA